VRNALAWRPRTHQALAEEHGQEEEDEDVGGHVEAEPVQAGGPRLDVAAVGHAQDQAAGEVAHLTDAVGGRSK